MKKLLVFLVLLLSTLFLSSCDASSIPILNQAVPKCVHEECDKTVIAPKCETAGMTKYRCTKCGYEYSSDFVPPLGHTLSANKIEATCSEQGYTLFYCSCGYSYASNYVPTTSHTLKCESFPVNCTEQGYNKYSCTECGYSYKKDFVPPTGHKTTSKTVRPTATSAGYTEYTCECNYSYRSDYIYYSDILETAYTDNKEVLARGIDISMWNVQSNISGEYMPLDFNAIKAAGFDFVIIKAGSTRSGEDPTFQMNYSGAKAAGLEVGAYYYTYSTTVEGILDDAEFLLTLLDGKQFEYPIYLDLEDPSLESLGKNHLSTMCVTFLEELQRNGYYAGLYTNHNWLTTILDAPRMVTLFDIWYARYPGTSVPTWSEELYGKQLGMWQYTSTGAIEGLVGDFDFNYAYKDYKSIMQQWHLNGY